MISKTEWTDWKTNLVTRAFYAACNQRVEDAKEILGGTAGIEPEQDNYLRGFIAAYKEMNDFRIEDIEEDD